MTQENQSSLRFSLEESLWFRKGQEVDELVSISLSPDITIQENDQYVNIRGALDLTGEYSCKEEGQEEDVSSPALRYVQSVDKRDEGLYEFTHRFPVDITIPVNRIESIYDLDVIVDSFDYTFPERSCMKLTADLIISGLYESNAEAQETYEEELEEILLEEQPREVEVEEEEEYVEAEEYEEAEDYTEAEYVQAEVEEQEEEEAIEVLAEADEEELVFEAEARRVPDDVPGDEPASFSPFPFSPAFTSYWNQIHGVFPQDHDRSEMGQYQQQVTAMPEQNVVYQQQEQQAAPMETAEMEAQEQYEVQEQPTEESSSSSSSPVQKKKSKKKSMSLTEFFARKDEREAQAKLKVCIVQKGDTLDRISDRYDVSVQNLLRYNNLEINQDVYEGQVLYIPATFAKK